MLVDELLDPLLGQTLGLGAEAVDEHGQRMRDPDRVGDLDLAALGEAGGDDVLRDVARGVRGRAVDLRRVLAREGTAAVRRGAPVGVDDDLPTRQPGVAHRPADHELAGRIDVDEVLLLEPLLVVEVVREDRPEDVVDQVGLDQRLGVEPVAVLRRDQDALDLDRPLAAVLVDLVAHRDLRLPVRSEVREHVGLADLGEPLADPVRQAESAAASARRSRSRRSRTSSPGRRRRRGRASRRRPAGPRRTRPRPGRCPPTARRGPRSRRRSRRRSRTWRAYSRSRRSSCGRAAGCRRRSRS